VVDRLQLPLMFAFVGRSEATKQSRVSLRIDFWIASLRSQ
jgi:hypothetical protein